MSMTYFNTMHESLGNDYGYGGIFNGHASCEGIAYTLAELLAAEGAEPGMLKILGARIEDGTEWDTQDLIPMPYEGRVKWYAHFVCEVLGIVYDPMLDTPLLLDDYLSEAFDCPVQIIDIGHKVQYLRDETQELEEVFLYSIKNT